MSARKNSLRFQFGGLASYVQVVLLSVRRSPGAATDAWLRCSRMVSHPARLAKSRNGGCQGRTAGLHGEMQKHEQLGTTKSRNDSGINFIFRWMHGTSMQHVAKLGSQHAANSGIRHAVTLRR